MKRFLKRTCALALAAGLAFCGVFAAGAADYSLPPAKMTVVYGGTKYASVAYKRIDDDSAQRHYSVSSPDLRCDFVSKDDNYWGDGHAPDFETIYFVVEGNHLGTYTIDYYDPATSEKLGFTEVECVLGGPLQYFTYYVLFGWAWMDNPSIRDTGGVRVGNIVDGFSSEALLYYVFLVPYLLWFGPADGPN